MAEVNSEFANNLHVLRLTRGYSQAELARRAGVDTASVVKWENGMHMPSLRTTVKLADALGCSMDELASEVPLVLTASRGDGPVADERRHQPTGRA